jgi:hypothetical protein
MTWLYVHDFPNLMRRFAKHPATRFITQGAKALSSLFAHTKKRKKGGDKAKSEKEKTEDRDAEATIAAHARNRIRLARRGGNNNNNNNVPDGDTHQRSKPITVA